MILFSPGIISTDAPLSNSSSTTYELPGSSKEKTETGAAFGGRDFGLHFPGVQIDAVITRLGRLFVMPEVRSAVALPDNQLAGDRDHGTHGVIAHPRTG